MLYTIKFLLQNYFNWFLYRTSGKSLYFLQKEREKNIVKGNIILMSLFYDIFSLCITDNNVKYCFHYFLLE